MGHPRKLLEACVKLVEQTYSRESYYYMIEKPLPQLGRISPDVAVFKNNDVQCVVEIGDTAAEKIYRYREQGIPDIRWYTKALELVIPRPAHNAVKEATMELDRGTPMAGPKCADSYRDGKKKVFDALVRDTFWRRMLEVDPKQFRKIKAAITKAEKDHER